MGLPGRGDTKAAGPKRGRGATPRGALATLSAVATAATLAGSAASSAAQPAPPPDAAKDPTPAEIGAARELFNQGKELEEHGAWVEALEKFRKVAGVKMTPQVRFHIALCEENLGQLVAAMNDFELATQEASRLGARAAEVLSNAPERLEALRQRIARLRIEVSDGTAGASVLLDGKALVAALVGTDIPVDPGAHTVELRTGDTVVLSRTVTLAERDFHVMELDAEHARRPAEQKPATAPAAPIARRTSAGSATSLGAHAPSLVAGGAGLLALAGAGVFFGLRESALDEVRRTCDPGTIENCSPETRPDLERGKSHTTVAAVLTGVGVAGLATAAVLWFAVPPKAAPGGARVLVAPQTSGVRIAVVF
jgi:hypothetical protein